MAAYKVPAWHFLACGLLAGALLYQLTPRLRVEPPRAPRTEIELPEPREAQAQPAILLVHAYPKGPPMLLLAVWEDGRVVWRDPQSYSHQYEMIQRPQTEYSERYIPPSKVVSLLGEFKHGGIFDRAVQAFIVSGESPQRLTLRYQGCRSEISYVRSRTFSRPPAGFDRNLYAEQGARIVNQLIPAKGRGIAGPSEAELNTWRSP